MKIRTFTAKDMRQALRRVREEQGPDAVILSTRHLENGVEVTTAVEPEALLAPEPVAAVAPATSANTDSEFADLLTKAAAAVAQAPQQSDAQLGEELRSMRHLLEWQLSQLAWNDLTRRAPSLAELLKQLTEMGVSNTVATELLGALPAGLSPVDAQRRALGTLSQRIAVTGDALLDHGGRVAFVGSTGVGKTTGIARLAARWVMRHGARSIALVSVDDQRFGAHEQLRVLGRLLGVETYSLENAAELPSLLERLPLHRMILIDTAGISPRDIQLPARAAVLSSALREARCDTWLTLAAGAQAGVLEESVQRFAAYAPRAVLLTKIDEASSLGGALSVLIASSLPVSYVTDGTRIPEDIAPARGHQLVARAAQLARSSNVLAGDELLARRFGGVAHAIR
jgi:flagellar biosynthesis protein FlhF